jgi:hypothetical protein
MTAKRIPAEGEIFKGYVPANRQVLHVTVGADSSADVQVGETGAYTLVSVAEPIIVFGQWNQIETAFTASVTLDIGDSTTAALLTSDTTIVPGSTGAILIAGTGLAVPYVYAAAQDLLVTVGGATVAAGLLHVYIDYAILAD